MDVMDLSCCLLDACGFCLGQLLRILKSDRTLSRIPVVMLSALEDESVSKFEPPAYNATLSPLGAILDANRLLPFPQTPCAWTRERWRS